MTAAQLWLALSHLCRLRQLLLASSQPSGDPYAHVTVLMGCSLFAAQARGAYRQSLHPLLCSLRSPLVQPSGLETQPVWLAEASKTSGSQVRAAEQAQAAALRRVGQGGLGEVAGEGVQAGEAGGPGAGAQRRPGGGRQRPAAPALPGRDGHARASPAAAPGQAQFCSHRWAQLRGAQLQVALQVHTCAAQSAAQLRLIQLSMYCAPWLHTLCRSSPLAASAGHSFICCCCRPGDIRGIPLTLVFAYRLSDTQVCWPLF